MDAGSAARHLNRWCHCVTTDEALLQQALDCSQCGGALRLTHPHLFSRVAVFVGRAQLEAMQALVADIEQVAMTPAWQAAVLPGAPATARVAARTRGLLCGYDFHLAPEGPRLIEVNTNAGGAFLNAALRRAQLACCDEVREALPVAGAEDLEQRLLAMFTGEWELARGAAPLRTVVIVDDAPAGQFLYPEFELAAGLLRRHGIAAHIADARELAVRDGALWLGEARIDMVYNRLTDFALDDPAHAAVREAWLQDLAVVSPHPRAHALLADKRNLVRLTDAAFLAGLGVGEATIARLAAGIPRTLLLDAGNAAQLWEQRRQWFFKPATGFGSRAAYRGDKLTRGKWEEILAAGGYVAQQLVPPSERWIDEAGTALKVDIRLYTWRGAPLLAAARLYQGQTTNLRTAGGGFAAVFPVGA